MPTGSIRNGVNGSAPPAWPIHASSFAWSTARTALSGGANIYPREVEEVLLRAEGVAEVSVIGRPDPEWGEVVVAYVVGEPGATLAPEALDRFCLGHIARFKRPKAYRFVPELPKNAYGKVLKTELRAWEARRSLLGRR